MKEVKRLTQKNIVELLLEHEELSVPKMSELLGVNPANVDYHLKCLVEKNIVIAKKRRYGSKYKLNQGCVNPSDSVYMFFSLCFSFMVTGVFFVVSELWFLALICFWLSSFAGVINLVADFSRERKSKVKALLQGLGG